MLPSLPSLEADVYGPQSDRERGRRLLLLQVIEDDGGSLSLDAPILNDTARAADDFASLAFLVDLAETSPLTKLLVVVHLKKKAIK